MKKFNNYAFKMRQKYGTEWDAPLFVSANPSRRELECATTTQAPLIIDDATEEKADIFNSLPSSIVEEQRNKVLEAFKHLGPATDNEVARTLNIVPSTVAARRNELRDLGLIVPLLDGEGKKAKRKDSITNQSNTLWKIIK
ncbi:MAG: hypothetical protein AB1432_05635 [Bacteroidota bacterium]|jgi:hypothetical protein